MRMAKEKEDLSTPLRDLAGFLLLAFAIFLFLSLISYSPLDPSLNTKVAGSPSAVHNWCGIGGSYASDIFMQLFGFASFFVPFALVGVAWAVVFRKSWQGASAQASGFILLVLAATLFLALAAGDAARFPPWGGVTGFLLRKLCLAYVGTIGALLAGLTALAVALVLSVRLTFEAFVGKLSFLGDAFLHSREILARAWQRVNRSAARFLELEEKKIDKGMAKIRADVGEPSISVSDSIKVAGEVVTENVLMDDFSIEAPAKEIPIVFPKASDRRSMPQFHTMEEEPEEAKAHKDKRDIRTYKLPDISLLDAPEEQSIAIDREELFRNAQTLEQKLKDFGVFGKVVEVQPGPVITMYEFEPAPGIKVTHVTRLNDDLALALKAMSVRITPLPGKAVIGIEVANRQRQVVYLKDVIADDVFKQGSSRLTFALGKDISGTPFVTDLRKMPHLLVAGATGSGKSVSVNSMILSVLYKSTPDEVRMILVDPKMLELSFYDNIPHLLLPVVTDPRKASAALRWAVLEMEHRYRFMADIGVRNIEGYNKKVPKILDGKVSPEEAKKSAQDLSLPEDLLASGEKVKPEEHTGPMPYIMIVIDELADLMMISSREVEESIIRLSQMARAAGIHLLLATQRPSVDVITGVIKANMPARISFQVSSKIDSRTILDANGAELLLGAGDMLFLPPGTSKLERIHGAFVTDNEVKRVTDFWKEQGSPDYDHEILRVQQEEMEREASGEGEDNEMYQQALNIIRLHRVASISMIQRKLRIGYNRAARIVERMDDEGWLAPGEVGKPREVRMSRFEV